MNRIIKNLIIIICFIVVALTAVNFVLAQTDPDALLFGGLQNETGNAIGLPGGQDPRVMAANIIRAALGFLGLVAVGIVIYAGWLWMTAAGDAQKIDKAKKVLLGALIGLLLIVASFGIVTFILGKILESVGGGGGPCVNGTTQTCGCGGTQTCAGGAWGVCAGSSCGGAGSFYVTSAMPTGNTVMNAKVRYYFSNNVDSSSVNNATLSVVGSGGPISGNYITTGKRVEFIPNGVCPANSCGAINCFPANDSVTVTATNGILDMLGTTLTCTLINPCTIIFTTNNSVDCNKPSVSLLYDNQVCLDTANNLGANASDDSGVSQVDFTDSNGGSAFTSATLIPCPGGLCGQLPQVWNIAQGTVTWQPTFPTYSAGTNYTITATADDIDSNQVSASQTFNLRPDYCCNGIQDGDETGFNCGGSCAACQGAACAIDKVGAPDTSCSDTLCASGFCTADGSTPADCTAAGYDSSVASCCLCQDSPIIDWVTPMGGFCDGSINTPCQSDSECSAFIPATCNTETPNGADGNLVTIGGRFFGAVQGTGKVEFSDDGGTTWDNAPLANTVNGNCDNSWQDTQIIVVVPAGLIQNNGKIIRVTADNGFFDITNDSRGAYLDFVINNISRPGLCELNPPNGQMNDTITYEGIRLTGVEARFGNMASFINALNNTPISATQLKANVPNIATGQTSTYVINAININSNFLNFTKDAEAPLGPAITSFEPVQGPPGQYVTIYGSGFGNTKGTSKVKFGATEADYSFPAVCANSVWSDNQVIVKVPAGLPNNNYIISMEIGAWVIDTSGLTPSTFSADSSLPLAPSLCKLEPIMGPNNSNISLYGEYFGAQATGLVRFHLNHNQSGGTWTIIGVLNQIETTVHQDAVTGPVKVVQTAGACNLTSDCSTGWECADSDNNGSPDTCYLMGNGLNFTVGNCTKDADCGGTTCCPAGSYKANMCAVDDDGDGFITPDDCYIAVSSSVYEWDFSTGAGSPVSTCAGYTLNQCALAKFCPNSPGECSPYAGGATTQVGNCDDAACNGVGACTASCIYNSSLNKCVDPTQPCDLNGTASDIFGKDVTKYCALYNGNNVWHINTPASCPALWTRIAGNKCVDSTTADTCDLCSNGFKCVDIGGAGQCVVDQNICPSGSTCNLVNDKCEKIDKAKCECCCEIGQDARDCCTPLKCEGTCGSDIFDDGAGYGMCSGCKIDSNGDSFIDPAEQTLSDAACNCAGTTGKYCDTTVSSGVCEDGATTGMPCYDPINGATCDPTNPPCASATDFCDATQGCTCQPITIGTPCDEDPIALGCNIINDICDVVSGLFCDPTSCTCQSSGGGGGALCSDSSSLVCINTSFNSCLIDYQCLDKGGSDCRCCCDPNAFECSDGSGNCPVGAVLGDSCGTGGTCQPPTNTAGLQCVADKGKCTGVTRGLYCGCSSDAQCVDTDTIGCGLDTCCRSRPTVTNVSPAQGATNICRNALLSATFDQTMDISSFSGNVIVVGDYETGLCPAGTEYILASGQKEKGFFARLFQKIALPFRRLLKPLFPRAQALTNNFCAIKGSVSGYHNANNTTTLTFSPSSLLDANRNYYVIIKGDSDLSDAKKEGVKSYYDVTMADSWIDIDGGGVTISDRTLNGVVFNGYIWSFTTRDDADNNGICKIARVEINPNSYLFQTTADDINEDDSSAAAVSFDTKKDSDKVFAAKAVSSDGQELASVAGVYEWSWDWTIGNGSVLVFEAPAGLDSNKKLVAAQPGVTDGFSELEAKATVSGSAALPGESYAGKANVWVFVCENPWPPVDLVTGLWSPWLENSTTNCTISLSSCPNTNYELYYCRDTAGAGTADDLPAILSKNTIIVGSPLAGNLLKEFYFFREAAPDVSGGVNLTLADQTTTPNGIVLASWNAVAGASGYKVYYGITSGSYSDYATSNGNVTNLLINNLTVGKTYYFTVTAYDSATGAESGYSTEVSITPIDDEAPAAPQNLLLTKSCDGEASVLWPANIDDTTGYKVYYGATTGIYGGLEDIKDATDVTLTGLTNGSTYYFAVKAYDAGGNESAFSEEISFKVLDSAIETCFDLNSGLVLWQTFDSPDISGSTAMDRSGQNNNGNIIGAAPDSAGIVGQALSFDGNNDYVQLLNPNFGSTHTVSFWATGNTLGQVIMGNDCSHIIQYKLDGAMEKIYYYTTSSDKVIFQHKIPDNTTWHHYVITRDDALNEVNFYVDGSPVDSPQIASALDNIDFVIKYIGGCNGGGWTGKIDEVRIYNRALSASEITKLYQQKQFAWACGDTLVDSRDGKNYATVLIGSQCWMKQGINVGARINGTSNQTNNAIIEKHCYSDIDANCDSNDNPNYPDGGLYQWGEAMQYAVSCNGTGGPPNDVCATPVQGICPAGWHIPSPYEWITLERAVCASGTCAIDFPYNTTAGNYGTDEGTKLKPGGSSGFEGNLAGTSNPFDFRENFALIWTSFDDGPSNAWRLSLGLSVATVSHTRSSKNFGFSIRCLKD